MLNAIWIWIFFSGAFTLALIAIPAVRSWASGQNPQIFTPSLLLFSEGITAGAAIVTGLLVGRIEKRSLADYGLALSRALAKHLAQGLLFGFAMVSAVMGLIAATGGFRLGQPALVGWDAARYGLLYLGGFLTLGFFEEFSFRGYFQATLAPAVGFWPAATLLSGFFAAIHLPNPGETGPGLLAAGCFGLLAAFSLRRTGSIWLAIGMHAAWDWGLTYLYSVPDSGVRATGHLLESALHGSRWLTGGSAGPEGSVFAFIVLILSAAIIHFMFPARRTAS